MATQRKAFIVYTTAKHTDTEGNPKQVFVVSAEGFKKNNMQEDNLIILDVVNAVSKDEALDRYNNITLI